MISEKIYNIIHRYRKNPFQLDYNGSFIINKIAQFIQRREPITILFPGCHGKIDNKELTIDHLPDLSEYLCVLSLNRLCDEVKTVYKPGIKVFLVHEGHFYTDTPLIHSDDTMDEYILNIRELLKMNKNIVSMTLKDFFNHKYSNDECRKVFYEKFCPTIEQMEENKMKDKYVAFFKEYFHYTDELAKQTALRQFRIWVGFRVLLKEYFNNTDYIRFSTVYKEPVDAEYVAINYIPSHHLEMPSANCVVKNNNGSYKYLTKAKALSDNYIIDEYQGFKYFKQVKSE